MIETLSVGLASWIIQDGNYGDFRVGDVAAFALELHAHEPFQRAEAVAPSMKHVSDTRYEVVGQVVHATDGWWAIDTGVMLFREEQLPALVDPGAWLSADIDVGIDPFFYFERLAEQQDAPALIYDWTIEAIEIQTAPFVEAQPRVFVRDLSRLGWRAISETSAWSDDGGNAWYMLRCRRRSNEPRRTR